MESNMLKPVQSIKAYNHPHCVGFFFIFNLKGSEVPGASDPWRTHSNKWSNKKTKQQKVKWTAQPKSSSSMTRHI